MKDKKIVYYSSLEDDFAGTNIKTKPIGKNYKYIKKSWLFKLASFLLYYVIAVPVVELYTRLVFGIRYENKKALKQVKGQGFFLYGTHSHWGDVFVSHMLAVRAGTRGHIIAGPDAFSIYGLRTIVELLGTIPIPDDFEGNKKMIEAISYFYEKGDAIAIYPEKHIWPYCASVREFSAVSFGYPAKLGAPIFVHGTFYRKRFFFKKPAMTIKISDPIYPDMSLPYKERKEKLRQETFAFLNDAVKGSYSYIAYQKVEH